MTDDWGPQQDQAIKKVKRWLATKNGPKVFRLFGFAGTGKTTLAKHLANDVPGGRVVYACYTGKAALVLRKKGCEGAGTIHSLIYKPVEDPVTGKFTFKINHDSAAAYAGLIIVDEVSMVDGIVGEDLLSFGRKVLVLGDPFQLPPVKGEGFFITAEPDVMLTDVHRQAADNPIIRMSMDVREGRGLCLGLYGESIVVRRKDVDKEWMREQVMATDQLLCGMNKTRQAFNQRIRDLKGLADPQQPWMPAPGDRLVCLRNNREKNLFNGGLWTMPAGSTPGAKVLRMRVESLDEPEATPVDIEVPPAFFQGTEKDLDWRERRRTDEFTFGWALTVHKSQGSQWDNVLVFDESHVFREDADKHLYTAVTRAAERVVVVI